MYRNLFTAWYCLGVLVLCFIAYLITLPYIGTEWARCGFGILGVCLIGLLPVFRLVFFRKEVDDERDTSFLQRALALGYGSSLYAILVLNCCLSLVYNALHGLDAVPLSVFWLPAICGLTVGVLGFSVLLLLFYYKGEHADKEG